MKKALLITTFLALVLGLRAETNTIFKCQVKVLDAQGQPVSGAVVERFLLNVASTPNEPLQAAGRDIADGKGVVAFASTNQAYYVLVASKPGLPRIWGAWYAGQAPDQTEAVVELAFTAPKAVSGVVQDAAGKPVGDAVVWVKTAIRAIGDSPMGWSFLPPSLSRRYFSTRTGADGKFQIEGLAEGAKLDLAITKPGMALDRPHEGGAFMNPSLMEIESGQSNIVLTLKPAGAIEGRVVKLEGAAPVVGARVTIATQGFGDDSALTTLSGSDGTFRLVDLQAGEYQLQARLGTNEPPDLVGDPESVTVEAGATNRQARLTLTPGGWIQATVKNSADEKPVPGAFVNASAAGGGAGAKTTEKGIAMFRLTPGDYQVFAQKDGRSASVGQVSVEMNKTNHVTLSFEPPAAEATSLKLTGKVLDSGGKPAPNVTVLLLPFQQGEKKTDAQGRFEFTANPNQFGGANSARVIIARDSTRNLAVAFEVEEDATNTTVRLEPGIVLAGRVTDPDGKPIAGAQIMLQFSTGNSSSSLGPPSKVDAQGQFRITNLPRSGRYLVTASATGFGQDTKTVEDTETDTNLVQVETFQLAPATLRLAGVVVDADDKPIAGAMLNGYGNKQPQINGRTDAKGHFSFDHVAPGPITLSANHPRGGGFGNISAEGGDTNVTIQVGLQQANFGFGNARRRPKVNGVVLDVDGKPASNVVVRLFPDYSNTQKRTDEAGRFALVSNPNQYGGGDSRRVIIARDLDHQRATALDLDEDATNADLRLEPGLTFAGRVTDLEGKPVTNAEAMLTFWTEHMGSSFGPPTKVDAEGRFEIPGLPPGRHYGVNVTAKGFGQDNRNIEAADTATRRVELETFQLTAANLRLAGVVLNADDKPVPGAFVNTFGGEKQPQLSGKADSKGRFTFDHVCPGPISLMANDPRGGQSGNVSAEGGDTNITIHLGSQEAGFGGANSRPRQKVKGVVLDAEGKPAAKVAVNFFPDFSNAQKKTDEAGQFVLTFDPNQFGGGSGSQRVILARDPNRNLAVALDVEEEATNATLRLAPGFTLVGHATDVNGKPLTNAQAMLLFRTSQMSSPIGQSIRANAEGQFEIKGLPASRGFSVTVSAKGYGQDTHNADTGEGENRRVELDPFQLLVADQRIAGFVLDADDKPVRGAYLYCYGEKQNGQNGQSDAKGHFSFTNLCLGTVRFSANNQRGGFANVQAEAGDTNFIIHLTMPGGLRPAVQKPAALRGKPLPDLAAAGVDAADASVGQPVLALVIDAEQRPCRRVLRLLDDHVAALKQKGVSVLVLQCGDMAEEAFTAWKQDAATAFPVVRLKPDPEKTRAAWGVGALPWFILADKSHRVIAEGFALDDLDAKLGEIK